MGNATKMDRCLTTTFPLVVTTLQALIRIVDQIAGVLQV